MPQRFTRLLPPAIQRRPRLTLAIALAIFLLPTLLAVHYGTNLLFNSAPQEYHDMINLIEEGLLLSAFFLMMWYYRKSRELLEEKILKEERLRQFIQYTPASVAVVDKNMTYLAVSEEWVRDFNLPVEQVISKSHYDLFKGIPMLEEWKKDHQYCLKGGIITRDEESFIGLDGKRQYVAYKIIPWREKDGSIGGLIFLVRFITEQVEAGRRLRESEARFERAMRSNAGFWDYNIVKDEIYFPPAYIALMGYEPDEMPTTIAEWQEKILHPDDRALVRQALDAHLRDRKPYDLAYRLRYKDGHYGWFQAIGHTERDEQGNPVYFSGIMVDVSERKRLEELKNEFVYVVTHELRTPLSALRGSLDLLPRLLGQDLPDKARRSLELSLQGCERLEMLVNDLLDLGRVESGKMSYAIKAHPLPRLMEKAHDSNLDYARQHQVTLVLHPVPELSIETDANRFHQIMTNLISNAVKFSHAGSEVRLHAERQNGHIVLSVHDSGEGIPEDFQKKIFQKFARSDNDKPGTGLGLNITKSMVEQMGGKIWFESEQGNGTVFFVRFPCI